tara:strand:+ start:874 stop:1596 length:723 start_codon:yes stop_codon:yes gene_type:complete
MKIKNNNNEIVSILLLFLALAIFFSYSEETLTGNYYLKTSNNPQFRLLEGTQSEEVCSTSSYNKIALCKGMENSQCSILTPSKKQAGKIWINTKKQADCNKGLCWCARQQNEEWREVSWFRDYKVEKELNNGKIVASCQINIHDNPSKKLPLTIILKTSTNKKVNPSKLKIINGYTMETIPYSHTKNGAFTYYKAWCFEQECKFKFSVLFGDKEIYQNTKLKCYTGSGSNIISGDVCYTS